MSEGGQDGSATFEFDGQDGVAEDLSRARTEQTERIHAGLDVQDSRIDQGITISIWAFPDMRIRLG